MVLKMLIKWVFFALALMLTAWLIPGISVSSIWAAMLACVIIAVINIFVKPVLQLLTLPINIVTIGLFTLVINALLFMFAAYLVPGIELDGFLSAFIGSIVISLLSLGINLIDKQNA